MTVIETQSSSPAVVVERKYPRWLMAVMAVGTAVFVVCQLGVGLTLRTLTYPVVAFPMFADAPKVEIDPDINAVTADGVAHHLTWSDFGLTHDQLNFYVNRTIAPTNGIPRMGAREKLEFLGRVWAAKHGNPVVTSVSLTFDEHALDGTDAITKVPIVSWTATS